MTAVAPSKATTRQLGHPGWRNLAITALAISTVVPLAVPVHASYTGKTGHGESEFSGTASCGPAGLALLGLGVDPGRTTEGLTPGIGPPRPRDSAADLATAACKVPAKRQLGLTAAIGLALLSFLLVAWWRRLRLATTS